MKNSNQILILLTGTVNVNNKHFTVLADYEQRKKNYLDTIQFYLAHYHFPIVFVENSGEDLSMYFTEAIQNKRIEILFFDGNNYPAEIGKGLGEMKCIEFAINNSTFITSENFIFKITGRYKIANFPSFINMVLTHPSVELIADLTNNFRFSSAAIFGFKAFFAKKYLFKNRDLINDSRGFYFEHALAKAVLEAIGDQVDFHIFKYYPKIEAISGTTGKPYKKSFLYLLPRRFKYWLRYLIVIR